MNRVELLAPAGNFDSAAAALENGADAVYCGLQEFSARKGARNFTLDQLSRLRAWTARESKKIYITINTILQEGELPRLLEYLYRLEEMEVDSVILQDPGLARIIRNNFPGITMHGSTQMGVHNLAGLKILGEAGFSRVVLPREMTLEEMSGFRKALPEMELEVFIHGAQCYGFSGMCLASGMLLNRSANRGECGQVCRTWFETEGERGYFLSSTDLWIGPEVVKLHELGIASLKIEGRMKSPAYAAAVSRYYRAILDGKSGDSLKGLEEDLRIAFSRNSGTGHFGSTRGVDMVDRDFPGHRGLFLGISRGGTGSSVQLDSSVPLHKRDGLMYMDSRGEPHPFSLDLKGSSQLPPGRVTIPLQGKVPPPGTEFYKIQSHDNHIKAVNENCFPPAKKHLPARITINRDTLTLELPDYKKSVPFQTEDSRGGGNLEEKIQSEFSKSSEYPFLLSPVSLTGEGLEIRNRFIPPSTLKKIRQELYSNIEDYRQKKAQEKIQQINESLRKDAADLARRKGDLPERNFLNPERGVMPFLTPANLNKIQPPGFEGETYFPLSPLVFPGDEEMYMETLSAAVGDKGGVIGINNWGHILFFRTLKQSCPSLKWYGDTGMLLANSQALLMLEELTGENCTAAYGWVEKNNVTTGFFSPAGRSFAPPLFISRNCFRKHSLKESCRNCGRSFEYEMSQKDRKFKVVVQECLTWIFSTGETGQGRNTL